ncbi:unnamed protein product [Mytilus coruscus]|uniref:DZIP3-like HEPN domain-containing protein n=1 Tax=Mytilus coruscus TaxID=42192 RepID=A0A6J8BH66_MYTCO|nr:unnamed protein product [Mytilus coruscus]
MVDRGQTMVKSMDNHCQPCLDLGQPWLSMPYPWLTMVNHGHVSQGHDDDVRNFSESLTSEEVNFLKIYRLCQKHAADAVRLIFDKHVPTSTITAHLGTFRSLKWNKNEQNLLFLVSGGSANSTEFDFSLLYKLIRNTFNHKIPRPTREWGPKPLSGDELVSDDIERIRYHRNSIAHNTELKINDKKFEDQWKDLSQVYKHIDN